jgi:hypothetical protein
VEQRELRPSGVRLCALLRPSVLTLCIADNGRTINTGAMDETKWVIRCIERAIETLGISGTGVFHRVSRGS